MIKKLHFPISGIAAALTIVFSPMVFAQEEQSATQLEELIVTGIRGSLKSSADIKRDNSGVVDSISAEDIGKFPDANLAESLQRITGVSIDRQDNEGNQISVRGLGPSFNLVTLNGRQMPVASSPLIEDGNFDQSRAFNFAEIASDSVAGVDVFKTARPDKPSGGIGATVDIRTSRPFDFDAGDSKVVLSAAGVQDFSNDEEDITPEVGGFFAHNFNNVVGFMVSGSFSERNFMQLQNFADSFNVTEQDDPDFQALLDSPGGITMVGPDGTLVPAEFGPEDVIFTPFTNGLRINDTERTRINGQAVFQVRPTENFTITADYTLSRFDIDQTQSLNQLFGDLAGLPLATNTEQFTVDENGTLEEFTIDFAGTRGIDATSSFNETAIENDSFGLNLKLEFDKVSLELDLHNSFSESQPDDEISDNFASFQGPLGLIGNLSLDGDIPDFTILEDSNPVRPSVQFGGPDGAVIADCCDDFFDSDGFAVLGQGVRNVAIDNEIRQAQFRGQWRGNDGDILTSIDFGIGFIEYDVDTGIINSMFQFSGLLPNNPGFSFIDLVDIEQVAVDGGNLFPFVNVFDSLQLQEALAVLGPALQTIDGSPNFDINTFGFGSGTNFSGLGTIGGDAIQESFTNIVEESLSFYLNTNWETEFNGFPVEIAAGLRVESTNVESTGTVDFPTGILIEGPIEAQIIFDEEADPAPFTGEGSYTNFLPAIDFRILPSDTTVLRLSYGRTLARPDISALRPTLETGDADPGGPFNAFQGNPDLDPFIADNIDAAFEYYYGDGSFFAATYFHKNVINFIGQSTIQTTIPDADGNPILDPSDRFVAADVLDPTVIPGSGPVSSEEGDPIAIFDVVENVNSDDATVDGIEVAIQHVFGDSGFGFQANYTFVDSNVEFDPFSLEQTQQSLVGLSDTANLVGFYENDNFEFRVAANWRDAFLAATNQVRTDDQPIFVDEFVQLDASASYIFNDTVSVFLEGLNLTGENVTLTGRFTNQFLFFDDQDPRLTLGVRVNF